MNNPDVHTQGAEVQEGWGQRFKHCSGQPGSLPCLHTEPLRSGQIVSMAGSKLAWHLMRNKLEALKKEKKKLYSLFLRKQISVISLNRAPLYDVETLTDSSYTGHSDWPYHPFQCPLEIGGFSVTCAKWLVAPKHSTDEECDCGSALANSVVLCL